MGRLGLVMLDLVRLNLIWCGYINILRIGLVRMIKNPVEMKLSYYENTEIKDFLPSSKESKVSFNLKKIIEDDKSVEVEAFIICLKMLFEIHFF